MLDVLEIMKRIPHRYPFLLVDRILEMDKENQTIKGKKNVTINEEFFNGHFPGHPIMPGVLIVEGMAQCLGVDVKVEKVKRNFVKATGKTYVDDAVVAEANFTFVIADL